jgi:hypothetical protein
VADCSAADLLLEQMPASPMLSGDKGYDTNAEETLAFARSPQSRALASAGLCGEGHLGGVDLTRRGLVSGAMRTCRSRRRRSERRSRGESKSCGRARSMHSPSREVEAARCLLVTTLRGHSSRAPVDSHACGRGDRHELRWGSLRNAPGSCAQTQRRSRSRSPRRSPSCFDACRGQACARH